jgi:hypothetical protein
MIPALAACDRKGKSDTRRRTRLVQVILAKSREGRGRKSTAWALL